MLTIFYGDQLYAEYPDELSNDVIRDIPDGSYIYRHSDRTWWSKDFGAGMQINKDLVPAICKAWMLIL
jgi:hypothetical protein